MKFKYFITIFLFSLFFLLPHPVKAQQTDVERLDITLSPVFLDLTATPSSTVKEAIRIQNNASGDRTFDIKVIKLQPGDDSTVKPVEPTPEDEYINWIKFENKQITIRAREILTVGFTITVPSNAAFGYYYAVMFQNVPSQTDANNKISGSAAVPILLNVKAPNVKIQAQVTSFTPLHFVNNTLPVDFQVTMENTGNLHIRPLGNIFIRNRTHKDIAILEVNPTSGTILPNGKRTFNVRWDDGFMVRKEVMEGGEVKVGKNGKPVTQLTFNWDKLTKFRLGPYYATMLMVYDDGQRDVPIEKTITFWVIPYSFIIIGLVGLVVFIVIIRFLLKWYVNKQLSRR